MTAAKRRAEFEGQAALEALLQEAGRPLTLPEVQSSVLHCLEEGLLPSEVVLRVVGKGARALPLTLSRRLASNLFALYQSLGREEDPTAKPALVEQLQALQAKAQAAPAIIAPSPAQKEALTHLQESLSDLALLSEEIPRLSYTRRLRYTTERSLQHLEARIDGALQILLSK